VIGQPPQSPPPLEVNPPEPKRSGVLRYTVPEGLQNVDYLLSFGNDYGPPTKQEQALFQAATAMTYAVWENYVEQVCLELANTLKGMVEAERMPEGPKKMLSDRSTWELAVYPGWRDLWYDLVKLEALGDPDGKQYGLNTADTGQVKKLFESVGFSPLKMIPPAMCQKLNQFIKVRGRIVHSVPTMALQFTKQDAEDWRAFVEELIERFDLALFLEARELTRGGSPW